MPMWPSWGAEDGDPIGGVRPVASGSGGSLAALIPDAGKPEVATTATSGSQALQALAQRTVENTAAAATEIAAPAADDTITVSGRSLMVTRLFGDNPELALTPDAASEDDMRLAQGKGVASAGGLDVAGKYGATQATHPALQAVVATGVLNKLGAAQLAALTPKNLAALLVFQFLTAADRQMLSQVYEFALSKNLDLALVDALAFDLGAFRSAASGASLIRDHVGQYFCADGRAVKFGFPAEDEAIAVRILSSQAMRDTAIPHDWLRFQLDPGVAIRRPRVPLAFLEQVVYALSPSGADGQPDPQAQLAPRPEQRLLALREAGAAQLPAPAPAASSEEQELTSVVQAQRYLARVDKVVRELPLPEVAASAAQIAALAQAPAAATPGLGMVAADASSRLVAGLLQVFTQHDKQLLAALYAGAETAHGPASPEINKLDLLVRQMALAAALGAVPGADQLERGKGKKRRERPGKGEHDEPKGRDYREFNAWLEEQSPAAPTENGPDGGQAAQANPEGSDGAALGGSAAQPAITADPRSSIGPRFAQELEEFIEHRKLYG